jgi:predicted nucleic acid-binding protein
MFYVDTSVLVLALTPEAATGRVLAWLGLHPAGGLLTSDWVVTEFSAALSIKLRTGAIDAGYRARTLAQFQRISMTKFATISITPATFRTAARFADQYASGLRAGDALHLALAADQAATIATLDTRLVVAAKALGIASMPL